jgi:hypothetical protein
MKSTYLLKFAIAGILIFGFIGITYGQNAAITTCATVAGAVPGSVSVPLTVTQFTNIGAVSLTLDYDYGVAQFVQGTPNPALAGFPAGDLDLGNGYHRISMGWYGSSSTLPDGTTIMTLNFNYTGGNTALTWFDNGSSCEYADPLGNPLTDTPQATYFIDGYICGSTGIPGAIAGNDTVCKGMVGEAYSIAPLSNVTGYTWTVPAGAVITGGQNTNSILVDFTPGAVSGTITACGFNECGNGPLAQLPVVVNPLPVANAGNDTTINYGTSTTLHAAPGGTGTFSYHWTPEALLVNPNVQNPQTVILTSTTLFTVTVTNLASSACQKSDDKVVAITGGPISVNPAAIPGEICHGEYSQLLSNAGGGSGTYTYQWTCTPAGTPPWSSSIANPLVSPEVPTLYQLSVFDGFTNISGTVNVQVYQLPTAHLSGGDTLCGTGTVTTLQVDLTGTPPWSFIYTNGINTVTVYNQATTPYYITTGEAGTYTLTTVQDMHCSGTTSGSASIHVFPYPATPAVTLMGNTLVSSVCCGNQWYLDNTAIPGATGQSLVATGSGFYYDIVTLNGCSSDTSDVVGVIVGISETRESSFVLAPNPAHDVVSIRYPAVIDGEIHVSITSTDGWVALQRDLRSHGEHHEMPLDISGFKPGIYFVTIVAGDAHAACKLIVN